MQKEHAGSNWGTTGAKYSGADLLNLLRDRPYIKTVLDFGAGKGTMGQFIEREMPHIEWTNYDPGVPAYDQIPEGPFDLVISTDVLEHVEPDALDSVLKTLARLTGKVLYSDIACFPTGKLFGEGPYIGQDLHLTVEDPRWWRDRFNVTGLKELVWEWREKQSSKIVKQRCIMIHERV